MNLTQETYLAQIEELKRENTVLKQELKKATAELNLLKQNEDKFRNVVEASPNGFILVDARGSIVLVNKKTESMFGYSREELLGQKVEMLIPMVHRHNHEHYRDEFFRNPVTRSMGAGRDLFGLHKNGSHIPVEIGLNPITTSEGAFVIASIIDITKRKQDEAAIKESEERLKIVLQNMPVMLRAFDTEGNLVVWNSECQKVTGYSADEMIGNPDPMNLLFPDHNYREQIRSDWYGTGNDFYNKEWKIRNKDGTFRFVSWSNISGKLPVPGWSAWTVGLDVTEQKKAEESLKESEEKFRSLFESITEGVALYEIVYDNNVPVDYRILDANPAFEHYCGIKPQMAAGNLATDIYQTEEPPYFTEYLEVATSRRPYRFETFFKDLNKHFMISVISPKKGQFATVFEDITEHKKSEQEIKQKNEELTRFIYTVSHDLKSPLVTIKSFTSYLEEDIQNQDTASQAKDIAYIQNAADKMGKLLDELLELSRIGRKEQPKTEVPLETVAQAAIDLVAGRISQKKAKVIFTGPAVMLYGHSDRLVQLYQNLIDNAVKFMGSQPEPLIEVGAYMDHEKKKIVMFVRDNGSGIDPMYHHKLFGLFEKLETNTEGTGIGLALIKRIVEVHGGSIWFTSEGTGKGATFYFTLEGTYVIDQPQADGTLY